MTALVPPDLIPNWIPGEKTADSSHLGWSGLTLKGYHYPDQEVNIPSMRDLCSFAAHQEGAVLAEEQPPSAEIGCGRLWLRRSEP